MISINEIDFNNNVCWFVFKQKGHAYFSIAQ
jgi:hypothetical protein